MNKSCQEQLVVLGYHPTDTPLSSDIQRRARELKKAIVDSRDERLIRKLVPIYERFLKDGDCYQPVPEMGSPIDKPVAPIVKPVETAENIWMNLGGSSNPPPRSRAQSSNLSPFGTGSLPTGIFGTMRPSPPVAKTPLSQSFTGTPFQFGNDNDVSGNWGEAEPVEMAGEYDQYHPPINLIDKYIPKFGEPFVLGQGYQDFSWTWRDEYRDFYMSDIYNEREYNEMDEYNVQTTENLPPEEVRIYKKQAKKTKKFFENVQPHITNTQSWEQTKQDLQDERLGLYRHNFSRKHMFSDKAFEILNVLDFYAQLPTK